MTTGRSIGEKCTLNIFFPLKNGKKIGKKKRKKSFNVNLDTTVCVLNPETPPMDVSILC